MGNIVVLSILVLCIGGAVAYIIRAKRNGVRCIGCSAGCNGSCSGCGGKNET